MLFGIDTPEEDMDTAGNTTVRHRHLGYNGL